MTPEEFKEKVDEVIAKAKSLKETLENQKEELESIHENLRLRLQHLVRTTGPLYQTYKMLSAKISTTRTTKAETDVQIQEIQNIMSAQPDVEHKSLQRDLARLRTKQRELESELDMLGIVTQRFFTAAKMLKGFEVAETTEEKTKRESMTEAEAYGEGLPLLSYTPTEEPEAEEEERPRFFRITPLITFETEWDKKIDKLDDAVDDLKNLKEEYESPKTFAFAPGELEAPEEVDEDDEKKLKKIKKQVEKEEKSLSKRKSALNKAIEMMRTEDAVIVEIRRIADEVQSQVARLQ